MRLALIDLDRVVADSSERFSRATRSDGRINWKIALDPALVELDLLVEGAGEALEQISQAGYQVAFLTGRPEKMRNATLQWFERHNIAVGYPLVMRPNGDYSKAADFKRREIETLLREYAPEQVMFVDDLVEKCPDILEHIECAVCYGSLREACEGLISS